MTGFSNLPLKDDNHLVMWSETVCYEQPMNELIRACLRLEHLFAKALQGIHGSSIWDSRSALSAIINIGSILERSDLRGKLSKELRRYSDSLSKYLLIQQVDLTALKAVLSQLETLYEELNTSERKIGQNLRNNEFLGNIRQYLFNPGGACSFDVPAYHAWLQQPVAQRSNDLTGWLKDFDTLRACVSLLLQLTRDSSLPILKFAPAGFFQEAIDPQVTCQMIRVIIPYTVQAYPEISAGKHRINIRFYQASTIMRAAQAAGDISFKLTCCII